MAGSTTTLGGARDEFWQALDQLVAESVVTVERPAGSGDSRFPDFVYPFDYGYLEETTAVDGEGVDVWCGSLGKGAVTGVVCTVDLLKRDAELKILLGCTPDDAERILAVHNQGLQAAVLLMRECGVCVGGGNGEC